GAERAGLPGLHRGQQGVRLPAQLQLAGPWPARRQRPVERAADDLCADARTTGADRWQRAHQPLDRRFDQPEAHARSPRLAPEMSRRRGRHRRRLSRTHMILGAITIALFAVLGYVSFTANGGLPLTSSYTLTVAVPNAERITKSDEVRINGVRVGQVQEITAVAPRDRTPFALLKLALKPSVGPLPADSTVSIGQASILGDSDVDIVRGRSRSSVPSGGSLPLANAHATVQLTDLLDIFNRSTANGIQTSLGAIAPALAGRGSAANTTIGALSKLLGP